MELKMITLTSGAWSLTLSVPLPRCWHSERRRLLRFGIWHYREWHVALLVKKDYYFMKVAIENLLVSTTTTEIVKTANNRKISIVFAYIRCSYYTERLEIWKSWAISSLSRNTLFSMSTSTRGTFCIAIHHPFIPIDPWVGFTVFSSKTS